MDVAVPVSASAVPLGYVRTLVRAEASQETDPPGIPGDLIRLCRATVGSLEVTCASIAVTTDEGPATSVAASSALAHEVAEIQVGFGEGPTWDAYVTRRQVLVPDLAGPWSGRWPMLVPAVRALGVVAMFAFPLQTGTARVGSLDLCRKTAGQLLPPSLDLALGFADLATVTLLDGQSHAVTGAAADGLDGALGHRAQLHQAQGMVMVALDVGLDEAMLRIRAYAFAHDKGLGAVARDIVARRVLLDGDVSWPG